MSSPDAKRELYSQDLVYHKMLLHKDYMRYRENPLHDTPVQVIIPHTEATSITYPVITHDSSNENALESIVLFSKQPLLSSLRSLRVLKGAFLLGVPLNIQFCLFCTYGSEAFTHESSGHFDMLTMVNTFCLLLMFLLGVFLLDNHICLLFSVLYAFEMATNFVHMKTVMHVFFVLSQLVLIIANEELRRWIKPSWTTLPSHA